MRTGKDVQERRRDTPRILIDETIELVDNDGGVISVTVTDVSRNGFRIQSDEQQLYPMEFVILRQTRHGDFPAQLKWAEGREAGGVFLGKAPELS